MKKHLLFGALLTTGLPIFAQDIIIKKSGEDIKAKVLEITQTEIKYKRWDNLEGPIIIIPKSGILVITYQNGTKELFEGDGEEVTEKPVVRKENPSKEANKEKAIKLLRSNSRVYVIADDQHVANLAKDYLVEVKNWTLVKQSTDADVTIRIYCSEVVPNDFSGYAEVIDPSTNTVLLRTSSIKERAVRLGQGQKFIARRLAKNLMDYSHL